VEGRGGRHSEKKENLTELYGGRSSESFCSLSLAGTLKKKGETASGKYLRFESQSGNIRGPLGSKDTNLEVPKGGRGLRRRGWGGVGGTFGGGGGGGCVLLLVLENLPQSKVLRQGIVK